jgi:CRISPR system Cascade subunit CasC
MFIEIHVLQNFAPANLNRDDTGAPKDCVFGGHRRARISSQALKRAMRTEMREHRLVPPEHLAWRTKRLRQALVERLAAQGKPVDAAAPVADAALGAIGLKVDAEGETQYLAFLGAREVDGLAALCLERWDALSGATPGDGSVSGRAAKKQAREAVPAEVAAALRGRLDGGKAVDLALFGRMLADLPDRNVDAAAQVAHALSTHRVEMEFDYFTAVDDLKGRDEDAGAGMLGTVEFNSACFYRYASVDLGQLLENLDGDEDLARQALEAFVWSCVDAIPTGKQNSMAAHNPPSLVLAVVHDNRQWSLANAFVAPVRHSQDGDLVEQSIRALDGYWARLAKMYGPGALVDCCVATMHPERLDSLAAFKVEGVFDLVGRVSKPSYFGSAARSAVA